MPAQPRARAAASGEPYRLLSTQDGLGIAEVGTSSLQRWSDCVTEAKFQRQREALEALAERYPGVASLVTVIEEDAPPPDPELRKKTIDMVASLDGRLRCLAVVVEGRGFKAAAIRSVLSGMTLLRRVKLPIKFTASVEDAANWVALQSAGSSADDICAGHERLKQSMS